MRYCISIFFYIIKVDYRCIYCIIRKCSIKGFEGIEFRFLSKSDVKIILEFWGIFYKRWVYGGLDFCLYVIFYIFLLIFKTLGILRKNGLERNFLFKGILLLLFFIFIKSNFSCEIGLIFIFLYRFVMRIKRDDLVFDT